MCAGLLKLVTVLGSLLIPTIHVFAQLPTEAGIQGTGSAVIERPAERMRMQIELLAKSKNFAEAVAKLKSHRTKVEKQLASLGAIKESIKFGDVRVEETQDDDQQRQMMIMMQQRASQRRGKRPSEKEVSGKPVKLAMRLTAEWPLKSTDGIDLLVESQKIQEAIKAADLAGMKDAQELTPEEAEVVEESEDVNMQFNGRQGPKQGEPNFIYVASIPASDREKALAEAVSAAKLDASQLAKAASVELGPLRSVNSGNPLTDFGDDDQYQQLYNSGFAGSIRQMMNNRNVNREAIGSTPGMLKFHVTVSVSYTIK